MNNLESTDIILIGKEVIKMKRSDIWSIPNLISYARILLMPVYVVLSLTATTQSDYVKSSFLLIFISGTDFLDGYVARKWNMVTELGKLMDPFADKLFQLAIALTLLKRIPGMWAVFIVFMVKELTLTYIAVYFYSKYRRKMDGAMWCGKLSSAVFYFMTFVMALCPPLPNVVYYVMESLMIITLLISFIVYSQFYLYLYKNVKH